MSSLIICDDRSPEPPLFATTDPAAIAERLRNIGIRFKRRAGPLPSADAGDDVILAACPDLTADAEKADVMRLTPDMPDRESLRQTFLSEHTHADDEIRFFLQGRGHFIMHVGQQVYDVCCTAGDLISVPADVKHWFDAGDRPDATVLRIFLKGDGWAARYTGDDIAARIPARAV